MGGYFCKNRPIDDEIMKDTYYIKLDVNTFEDPKVKLLIKNYNLRGFGSWIRVVLILRNESDRRLEYSDFVWEALSVDLEWAAIDVKTFIDDCIDKFKLFTKEDGYFYSERLNRDVAFLEERREQKRTAGRISAEKRWGKPVNDFAAMVKVYEEKVGKPLATARDAELIKDIANTYPFDQFVKAVDAAIKNKATSLSYIAKILENHKEKPAPVRRSYDDSLEGMREAE